MEKLIRRLEREGKIRKKETEFIQVEALLKEAILDLDEAKRISKIAERATFLLAYNAMLKAGRALMMLKGYLPANGGQHKTVVDMTGATLGDKFQNLCGQFERMRRKRNELTYEAGIAMSKTETKRAFSDAQALVKKILDELKSQNPQLKMKFFESN